MELFATFGLIILVGLAIPILLLISALMFDLAVVIYVASARMRNRVRLSKTPGTVPRSIGPGGSRGTAAVWRY